MLDIAQFERDWLRSSMGEAPRAPGVVFRSAPASLGTSTTATIDVLTPAPLTPIATEPPALASETSTGHSRDSGKENDDRRHFHRHGHADHHRSRAGHHLLPRQAIRALTTEDAPEAVRLPRICSVPTTSPSSIGMRAIEWAYEAGIRLDAEQQLVLERSMGLDEDGRWERFEVGLNQPRQNGKGEVLMVRELFGVFELGEGLVVHSAHEFKTSQEHFRRVEALVQNTPHLHSRVKRNDSGKVVGYRHSHGEESIELEDGSRIVFVTRTKSGLRGFTNVGLMVLDEAMIINESSHGAMMPTLRASKAERGPQLWYAGSAVDQLVHDHGVVWARIRERGIADDSELAYLEWSAPAEHPSEVSDAMAADEETWYQVNTALGRRVRVEHMRREYRSMALRTFVVELLGVGDWPDTEGTGELVITAEQWADRIDEMAVMQDPICIAFDVSPDRRTSIVATGLDDRGRLLVELVENRSGTNWVSERLEELYRTHDVVEIVCDGYGPSASIANKVDEVGITVRRLNSNEHSQACGRLVDGVTEGTLVHLGQDELTSAVRGARPRPLGDSWAWSRKNSAVDISPLVAATLAHSSAIDADLGNDKLEIF